MNHDRAYLIDRLTRCRKGEAIAPEDLAARWLDDQAYCQAFGLTNDTVLNSIGDQLAWIQVNPDSVAIDSFETLWDLWLPLARSLVSARSALGRPIVQGVLGGQGTGKTTLGKALASILATMGYKLVSLSIDDLYKTYSERMELQRVDPRLVWRGPPGTHDVELGIQVLDQLRQGSAQETAIPRFDKSLHQGAGDRTEFEMVHAVDVVIFEGWFVGARPIDPSRFDHAPAPILTEDDRAFARDINQALYAYLPLWERCDRLMVLYPEDYRFSLEWRKQAERDMIAQGKSGMSEIEIEKFVYYFWKALHPKLFIQPLTDEECGADLIVEIDVNHCPSRIYSTRSQR